MTDLLQSLSEHLCEIHAAYGQDFFDPRKIRGLDEHEQERRDFMRLLRLTASWMRTRAIEERPPLFLEKRPGRLVFAGNLVIEVDERGCILVPEMSFCKVRDFAKTIYLEASHAMFSAYGERLYTLLAKKLAGSDVPESFLRKAIDRIVVNLMDKQSMLKDGVRWWSAKSHRSAILLIGRALWDANIFRKDIFSVAIRVHGFNLLIEKYNAAACSLEQLKERIAEAPHLAPWLYSISLNLTRDEVGIMYDTSPEVLKNAKQRFLEEGGSEQGWKWLTKQGWKWAFCISPDFFSRFAKPVSLLASLQVGKIPFHYDFVRYLADQKSSDSIQTRNILLAIKAAVIAYKKRKVRLKDIEAMFPLVHDYVESLERPLAPKTSWRTLCERQRRWHQEQAWKKAEEARANNRTWPALLNAPLYEGNLVLVELSQSFDLFEEGTAMGHCVGSYVPRCLEGTSRIFSVRRGENRLATIELAFSPERGWFLAQCYGPRNAIITDKAVLRLAKKLERMCASKAIPTSYKTAEHAA